MKRIINFARALCRDTEGVTSIEYALLASLIAMVILSTVIALGAALGDLWGWVANCVTNLSCA